MKSTPRRASSGPTAVMTWFMSEVSPWIASGTWYSLFPPRIVFSPSLCGITVAARTWNLEMLGSVPAVRGRVEGLEDPRLQARVGDQFLRLLA